MTTKVRFIQSLAVEGLSYDSGDVVTFDDDECARGLVDCGAAKLSYDTATLDHATRLAALAAKG